MRRCLVVVAELRGSNYITEKISTVLVLKRHSPTSNLFAYLTLLSRCRTISFDRLFDIIVTIALFILGALLLYRAPYYPELGYDESASVLGKSILEGHFGNRQDPIGPGYTRYYVMDCYPPVYYVFSAVIFKIFGFGIVQARAVSVIFVLLTGALCYWAVRRYSSAAAALVAIAAFIVIPVKIYTVVGRPDVAIPFFLLLSVIALLEAKKNGSNWLACLSGCMFSLGVLSHFAALMAGPWFFALLWWVTGKKIWKSKSFYFYAAGFLVPVLCYVFLLYPHTAATLSHLVNYKNIGLSAGSLAGITSKWPVRPTLQHLATLSQYYPFVLYGLVPLTLISLVAGIWGLKKTKKDMRPLLVFSSTFIALFISVGAYPNISIYGYYGPIYLIFGIVAFSILFGQVFSISVASRAFSIIIGVVAVFAMTTSIWAKVQSDVQRFGRIPLTASLDWTYNLKEDFPSPTLATTHWLFSAAGTQTLTPRVIRNYSSGFALDRDYLHVVPNHQPLTSYRTMISDSYTSRNNIADILCEKLLLLRAEPKNQHQAPEVLSMINIRLTKLRDYFGGSDDITSDGGKAAIYHTYFTSPSSLEAELFRPIALFYDGYRLSANYAVFKHIEDGPVHVLWPRVGHATTQGAEELSVDDTCVVSYTVRASMNQVNQANWLWNYQVNLEAPASLKDDLLMVRTVVQSENVHAPLPKGFIIHFRTRGEYRTSAKRISSFSSPVVSPQSTTSLLGHHLLSGERGADIVIKPGVVGEPSVLSAYSFGPAIVERLDFALALRPGQSCNQEKKDGLQRLVRNIQLPSVYVVDSDKEITSGNAMHVWLSGKSPVVRLVVFTDGKIVATKQLENVSEASVELAGQGEYGIEVWTENPEIGSRKVESVFVKVR